MQYFGGHRKKGAAGQQPTVGSRADAAASGNETVFEDELTRLLARELIYARLLSYQVAWLKTSVPLVQR